MENCTRYVSSVDREAFYHTLCSKLEFRVSVKTYHHETRVFVPIAMHRNLHADFPQPLRQVVTPFPILVLFRSLVDAMQNAISMVASMRTIHGLVLPRSHKSVEQYTTSRPLAEPS
jgi:hypothetical protein